MLRNLLSLMSAEIKTFLISVLPVVELRGAIPAGIGMGLPPSDAFIIAYLGSLLPVPFLLLLLRPVFKMMARTTTGLKVVNKLKLKAVAHSGRVQRYGWIGLLIFVAIPIPGTGIWSGSLAAVVLDIRFRKAFPAIAIGNLIAGLIIMTISYGGFVFLGGL